METSEINGRLAAIRRLAIEAMSVALSGKPHLEGPAMARMREFAVISAQAVESELGPDALESGFIRGLQEEVLTICQHFEKTEFRLGEPPSQTPE